MSVILTLIVSNTVTASSEFDEWKKKQEASFTTYLNEEQAAFRQALETDWENFKLAQPNVLYSEPKFDEPPVAPKEPKKIVDVVPEPNISPEPSPIPMPEPVPEVEPEPIPAPEPTPDPIQTKPVNRNQIEILYLGRSYQLPKLSFEFHKLKADNTEIAEAWESLYPELPEIAETIGGDPAFESLSDWALISLLNKYAKKAAKSDENGGQLILWALLMELGYDARLAYDKQHLYVLLPSKQKIYGKSSLNFHGINYYLLTGRAPESSLYTHTKTLDTNGIFDFAFSDEQPVKGLIPRKHKLKDEKSGISVSYLTYPQLGEYYRYHPLLDFVWYFRVSPSDPHYLKLVDELKVSLNGLSDMAKVRALLSLIQYGFEYKRDHEQWGEEYYSTPMHTLMLDAVDCEDRSFLFAYLVEQVVGIDTVGLKYPGHLAVAVAVDSGDMAINSDYVVVEGRKFYVADPTYIGADVGQAMTTFNGVTPQIINKH